MNKFSSNNAHRLGYKYNMTNPTDVIILERLKEYSKKSKQDIETITDTEIIKLPIQSENNSNIKPINSFQEEIKLLNIDIKPKINIYNKINW